MHISSNWSPIQNLVVVYANSKLKQKLPRVLNEWKKEEKERFQQMQN